MTNPILRGSRAPVDSRELRIPGSSERIFGTKGKEISASNSLEALKLIKHTMDQVESGFATLEDTNAPVVMTASEQHELLRTAYNKGDVQSKEWKAMGMSVAQEISQYSVREGFFRNFLERQEVADGQKAEITVVENHVQAVVATSPSQLQPQYISDDNTFYPPEFEIKAHVRIHEQDLNSSSVDLLDRRYNQALESVMVQEDRCFKNIVDEVAGTELPNIRFGNSLTPANIIYLRQMMEDQGVTPANVLLNSSYMSDFIVNNDFQGVYDPVTQREILQTGKIMTGLYGLTWWTDSNRKRPNLRVLGKSDFYMFAAPSELGAYTDRGPIRAIPVDGYNMGETSRGWLLTEFLTMALYNLSAVIKGSK